MWSAFVRGAWRKLPVEMLVIAMAAAGAIGLVHAHEEVWALRLLLAGIPLTPLAFAAHGLGWRRQALVIAAATAAVLVALTVALPEPDAVARPTFGWPYGLAVVAAVLVPFVAAAARFTGFVRRFFEETTTWGLLCLCAQAALGVIVLALDELFALRVAQLGKDASIVLTAGFLLVYLDHLGADEAAAAGRMPELWRRLASAVGAPFVSIMLVILVAYELVVGVRGELPNNLLSPLILAAGFIGFVSTLILASVLGDVPAGTLTPADPHRWARRPSIRLARAFPVVLLALLPMAGWALRVRIEEYGFTPFRVVRAMGLLCLFTLSVAGTLRWWRGRAPLSWQVPATIAGFALAAAFGPISAVRLSIASQTAQLARRLDATGLGRVVPAVAPEAPRAIDAMAAREIEASIEALATLGGEPTLRRVLSGDVAVCAERWVTFACRERLGLASRSGEDEPSTTVLEARGRFATEPGALALVHLRRWWTAPGATTDAVDAADAGRTDELVLLSDAVVLHAGGQRLARASLVELMALRLTDRALPLAWIPLRAADGTIVAQLAVQQLAVQANRAIAQATELTGMVIWPR